MQSAATPQRCPDSWSRLLCGLVLEEAKHPISLVAIQAGPRQLILQCRVRCHGLSSSIEFRNGSVVTK
jgi:hypothetical protein